MKNIYLSDLKIALRKAMRAAHTENDEVAHGVYAAADRLSDQLEMTDTERKAFMDFIHD